MLWSHANPEADPIVAIARSKPLPIHSTREARSGRPETPRATFVDPEAAPVGPRTADDTAGVGLLVAVVADDIFAEKAVDAIVGRGAHADEKGVEVVEQLRVEERHRHEARSLQNGRNCLTVGVPTIHP